MTMRLWGWFDDPLQVEPSYEPPRDAPCPHCLAPLKADDVRTICMMTAEPEYAKRSYFYRLHRTCHEAMDEADRSDMDQRIFSAIAKAGD